MFMQTHWSESGRYTTQTEEKNNTQTASIGERVDIC